MTAHRFVNATVHVLEHTAAVIAGFVLAILGMGLTFTGVFTVLGIIVLAIGTGLIVVAIWAHQLGGP